MTSLRHVIDRVGPTLLQVVVEPDADHHVADVVIAEDDPNAQIGDGDLVLGIGRNAAADAATLIETCAAAGAVAVAVKPPTARRKRVRDAAVAAGLALVEVHAKTSWAQLVWLLRTVLDAIADESGPTSDAASADLFRLADATASVVDAPVTIEDVHSRVLAYSARQDRTDPARVSTIMGRRIPDDVLAKFRSRGVFKELSAGRQTVYVPAQPDGTLPRLIVPIRMGGELLGSMWAIVDGPVSAERAAAFADAAPVVAVHLLRRRASADAQRKATSDLLRGILDGTASTRRAASELGLSGERYRVVAIGVHTADRADPGGEGLRLALLDRLWRRVGWLTPGCTIGDMLYLVVDDPGGWDRLQATLAKEAAGTPRRLLASAGTPQPSAGLGRSRTEADEALGLLRAGLVDDPVIAYDGMWAPLALHRAAVAASGSGSADLGPLPQLLNDGDRGDEWVDTLYAWLRHTGDPRGAARELNIHPNTLRYRMRKVVEHAGVDFDDPQVRLALLVQLALLRWR